MAVETAGPKKEEKKAEEKKPPFSLQDLPPEARRVAEAFLEERSRARAVQFAQMGFGSAAPQTASEDLLVQGILGRIYGGGMATVDERRYLRRKLEAVLLPTGVERIPLPLQTMTPMERLQLGAALDAIRHAAGE